MMWYWGGGVHWWGWLIGFVAMVAFWTVVVMLIISLFRGVATKDHDHAPAGPETPERILARRFANGEIDEDEFNRRLDLLRSHDLAGKR